ncbi:esterase-like activity of phytase family protein [Niabella beijingensis]|uniref:esterase-like activity of phytase family protein n=1 Tax=Niabella beijingensis TaxID=2872700 RepID=UPI001CBEA155|nr:esterase-like activity of phytase family protein [Niabella beijingensis]MBZ4192558.1 esterase-like activity of phytase family protein [Niabella beijingensis]
MNRKISLGLSLLTVMAFAACKKNRSGNDNPAPAYPDVAEDKHPKVLTVTPNNITLYNGGYGSSLAQDPYDRSVFYLLTDRGPNVAEAATNSIMIADPGFVPQIGKFRLKGDSLVQESTILLKNSSGAPLNGLPNPLNAGATGENPFDLNGKELQPSEDGIDSEGMALAPDGSFWISDEYGPHIIHVDRNGKTLEKINPFSTGSKKLPLVLAKRRPNRGMEGLTITPDGKTLVGIMQFPLYNPSSAAITNSLAIRILTFDIATGNTKQFVYMMDNWSLQAVSEIAAIDNNNFLVLERDGQFATAANRTTVFKKLFKISLSGATDISDPANGANGKLFGGKTVEELKDAASLAANGIVPVTKTLVADLMKDISTVYPHDKAEGLAIINPSLIAVSNDDDFGITGADKIYQQKILPFTNKVDRNSIYFIKLSKPLY